MSKKLLRIVIALWSIFITIDEVTLFFTNTPLNWAAGPYVAILLMVVAILLFIPSLKKVWTFLVVITLIFFGYFAVMGVIGLITGFADLSLVILSSTLKNIVFYVVPAILAVSYLTSKDKKA